MSYIHEKVTNFPDDTNREFKKIAEAFAALNVKPAPTPLWSCDFSKWPTDYGFSIQAKDPSRVILVNVDGRPGVRLLTMPEDININGSGAHNRCDLRLGNDLSFAKEGNKVTFKHSVLFPLEFVQPPESGDPIPPGIWQWGSWFNWHDDRDNSGSQGPVQGMFMPATAVSADRPTGLIYQFFGGTTGNKLLSEPKLGPIVRNKWYDFESDIYWTSTDKGFYETTLDGTLIFSYKGPTLHAGAGAYLKLANYHTAGLMSAIIHGKAAIFRKV